MRLPFSDDFQERDVLRCDFDIDWKSFEGLHLSRMVRGIRDVPVTEEED